MRTTVLAALLLCPALSPAAVCPGAGEPPRPGLVARIKAALGPRLAAVTGAPRRVPKYGG